MSAFLVIDDKTTFVTNEEEAFWEISFLLVKIAMPTYQEGY